MAEVEFFPYPGHEGWEARDSMVARAYPEFMNHDPIADRCFPLMYEMYPEWLQLAVVDGRPIGFFDSVPLPFDGPDEDLPDEGWDWAIDLATRERVEQSKTACGIQIVVDPDLHGRGYARAMVAQMKANAAALGCERLVVPIRPTGKPSLPHMPMADYAQRRRPDGSAEDPWQRVHESLGAVVVKPCERAMVIPGSIAQWEEWTGFRFEADGEVVVPGALAPVTVDLEADLATYIEPNLWMRHDV